MKTFIAIIRNKPDCPMSWGVAEAIKANTTQVAHMYADIAANQWNGVLVSLQEGTIKKGQRFFNEE